MSPVIHRARTLSLVFFTAGVLSVLGGCEVESQDDELFVSSVACFSQEQRPTLGETVLAGTPAHLAIASEPIVQSPPLGDDLCETDADCVPDGCHATSCVAAAELAPQELACTLDCRAGTIDCGGGCLCRAGHCAARLAPRHGI